MEQFLLEHGTLLTPTDIQHVTRLLSDLREQFENDLETPECAGVRIRKVAKPYSVQSLYSYSGVARMPASAQTTFDLLCNIELMPEWDLLFKGGRYLNFASDPSGRVSVAHLHIVYGLPGIRRIVYDRDFVIRCVRVSFPNGVHVLSCTSLRAGEVTEGDPGPVPGMVRGHMWESGYVVLPTRDGGCCVNLALQVDPRGWIPHRVVNFAQEASALNVKRIDSVLRRLSPAVLAQLPQLNREHAMRSRFRVVPPAEDAGLARRSSSRHDGGAEAGQQQGAVRRVVEAGSIVAVC